MIVADSNLIAYLLIPGDKSAMADEVFLKDPDWAVPLICRSEIRNILTLYMRHEKMSLNQAQATMEKAERLWREHEPPGDARRLALLRLVVHDSGHIYSHIDVLHFSTKVLL